MANKKYNEFPAGTYDKTKLTLQGDPVTGMLEKITQPFILGTSIPTGSFNADMATFIFNLFNAAQIYIGNADANYDTAMRVVGNEIFARSLGTALNSTAGLRATSQLGNIRCKIEASNDVQSKSCSITLTDSYAVLINNDAVFADNTAALAAGLPIGAIYRTGDLLKIVHV
jgi:hypothetical protein